MALCAVVAVVGLEGMSRPFVYLARAEIDLHLGHQHQPLRLGLHHLRREGREGTAELHGARGELGHPRRAVLVPRRREPRLGRGAIEVVIAIRRGLGAAGSCGTCRLSPRAIQFWRAAQPHRRACGNGLAREQIGHKPHDTARDPARRRYRPDGSSC